MSEGRQKAVSALVAGPLDWEIVLAKASQHRLGALLFHHLNHRALSHQVPPPVLQRLQQIYTRIVDRNLSLERELLRVLQDFNAQGIPTIVLKGTTLARSLYGDIGLRPTGDIDVLVRPRHLEHAEAAAKGLGYRILTDAKQEAQTRRGHRHLPQLFHPGNRIVLEIHWHIVRPDDPGHFPLDGFWARARPAPSLGSQTLTLAPEDLLVHLCIQFFLDRRYYSSAALGKLCDISEVVRQRCQWLDWSLVEKTASEHEIKRLLYCTLYTARELLGSSVPAKFMASLRPPEFNTELAGLFIRRRVVDTRSWMFHGLVAPQSNYSRARVALGILRRFFPRSTALSQKYGIPATSRRLWLLRLRWPIRAFSKGVRGLWHNELKDDLMIDRWLHSLSRPSLPR